MQHQPLSVLLQLHRLWAGIHLIQGRRGVTDAAQRVVQKWLYCLVACCTSQALLACLCPVKTKCSASLGLTATITACCCVYYPFPYAGDQIDRDDTLWASVEGAIQSIKKAAHRPLSIPLSD